jgi:hypothetical protein
MESNMATPHVVEDKTLSHRLAAGVTTQAVMQILTRRYGSGWQTALSEVLGISSRTVNDWIRKEKMPQPVKIAIGAILINRSQIQGRWSVVQDEDVYLVCDTGGSVGRIVARAGNLADAMLIAAAPVIKDAYEATNWVYESYFEGDGLIPEQHADEETAHLVDDGLTLIRQADAATATIRKMVDGETGGASK